MLLCPMGDGNVTSYCRGISNSFASYSLRFTLHGRTLFHPSRASVAKPLELALPAKLSKDNVCNTAGNLSWCRLLLQDGNTSFRNLYAESATKNRGARRSAYCSVLSCGTFPQFYAANVLAFS